MRTRKPYEHDCTACVWVGWLSGFERAPDKLANVYHCAACDGGTVLIRYGDRPEQYWSMPVGACVKGTIGIMDGETENKP